MFTFEKELKYKFMKRLLLFVVVLRVLSWYQQIEFRSKEGWI